MPGALLSYIHGHCLESADMELSISSKEVTTCCWIPRSWRRTWKGKKKIKMTSRGKSLVSFTIQCMVKGVFGDINVFGANLEESEAAE